MQTRLMVLKWGGAGLLLFGIGLAAWLMVRDLDGVPHRYWKRYIAFLEAKLQRQFIFAPGSHIAMGQIGAMFAIFAVFMLTPLRGLLFFALMVTAAIGPPYYIELMRIRRVRAIERQIDGFLVAMSNALKATPSIGDAFASTESLTAPPLKEEIGLALKEMRVGSTLDQALLLMAHRIGSRQIDSALSALLVGRQVGGNLPQILDTTAGTLREMSRLDGLVRAKTAEGKAQLMVLSVFPIFIVFAFSAAKADYFDPLMNSVTGYIITIIAVVLWVASLVLARKIVAVEMK